MFQVSARRFTMADHVRMEGDNANRTDQVGHGCEHRLLEELNTEAGQSRAMRSIETISANNPGGILPGATSRKFDSDSPPVTEASRHIAVFKDVVSGAAAEFDLLNSRMYRDLTVKQAMDRWKPGASPD